MHKIKSEKNKLKKADKKKMKKIKKVYKEIFIFQSYNVFN